MAIENPFVIIGYQGPDTFCDRKTELNIIQEAIQNRRNITLYADRRIGKTGLIHQLFHQLPKTSWITVYLDVLPSLSAHEFVIRLANALLETLVSEKNILTKIVGALSSLRPKVSIDPLTGTPSLELDAKVSGQLQPSISHLMDILQANKKQVILALDEFQQVTTFEDLDMEALIRSLAQQYARIRFIYSGSKKHLLLSMFTQKNRPFYQSTQLLELLPLPAQEYKDFIIHHFATVKSTIGDEAIERIFEVSRRQTYYSQLICNRLFAKRLRSIQVQDVNKILYELLLENRMIYFNYRNLLTIGQWKLLVSIAKEGIVLQPGGKHFMQKYALGAASSVSRSLQALLDKVMIVRQEDDQGVKYYEVEDALFAQWLIKE